MLSRVIVPVPGVLDVIEIGPYARLEWGPLAGILRWQEISEWKRDVLLVMSADLTRARCAALGVQRPEDVIAAEDSPTRAAVTRAPAYCVDAALFEALLGAGCRLCHCGYHSGSGELRVELYGPGWAYRHIELIVGSLQTPTGASANDGRVGADWWIDRVLRAATGGLLNEAAVRAAVAISEHVDDLLVSAEARARRATERAQAEAFARDDPELAQELGWMFEPSAPFQQHDRDDELRARQAAGASTRPLAEALARALEGGMPPTRTYIQRLGWIPILRASSVTLRLGGSERERELRLPAAHWAERWA
ncbi:MAG: hypothetical protein R3A79_00465 [Nannocystaceae bacterium]